MAAFPTPFTVQHAVFTGTGEDDLGNDEPGWADPVEVKVIGWGSGSVESLNGHTSRVVADIDMSVPPTLTVGLQDRFILPGTGLCEVVAVDDWNHGFHQWQPGFVVKLNRVSG